MSRKPRDPPPMSAADQALHDMAHNDYLRLERPDPLRTARPRPVLDAPGTREARDDDVPGAS